MCSTKKVGNTSGLHLRGAMKTLNGRATIVLTDIVSAPERLETWRDDKEFKIYITCLEFKSKYLFFIRI